VRGKGFIRMRIKLAGACVPLNGGVELLSIEGFEPGAKPRKLVREELFDGFLDVFGGGHVQVIAFARGDAKAMGVEATEQSCVMLAISVRGTQSNVQIFSQSESRPT
jgi:hypothetical protein